MISFSSIISNFFASWRNHGGPGSNDKFGRYTKSEQENLHSRNGSRENKPDTFVVRKREPSAVSSYTDKVIGREIDYSQTAVYKRAHQGYSTGTIFSSGISRLGSLSSLFNSVMQNPLGGQRYEA